MVRRKRRSEIRRELEEEARLLRNEAQASHLQQHGFDDDAMEDVTEEDMKILLNSKMPPTDESLKKTEEGALSLERRKSKKRSRAYSHHRHHHHHSHRDANKAKKKFKNIKSKYSVSTGPRKTLDAAVDEGGNEEDSKSTGELLA